MKMVDTKRIPSRARPVVGVRVNRTGRRTYTLQYKLDVVRQCGAPGVSVAAIAMAYRVNANLVRRWIVRHRRELAAAVVGPRATMLPVVMTAATSKPSAHADDLVVASAKRSRPVAATIEIELYGVRIHLRGGVDAQALRSVLDVLARR
jgi:transposase-like protein